MTETKNKLNSEIDGSLQRTLRLATESETLASNTLMRLQEQDRQMAAISRVGNETKDLMDENEEMKKRLRRCFLRRLLENACCGSRKTDRSRITPTPQSADTAPATPAVPKLEMSQLITADPDSESGYKKQPVARAGTLEAIELSIGNLKETALEISEAAHVSKVRADILSDRLDKVIDHAHKLG